MDTRIFTGTFAIFLLLVAFSYETLAVFGGRYVGGIVALVVVALAQL